MAELIAKGPHGEQVVLPLTEGPLTLGRSSEESDRAVPWDLKISRIHADLQWTNGILHVRRRPQSRNRIFYRHEAKDDFAIRAGEQFLIGDTTFVLEQEYEHPQPQSEVTCTGEELRRFRYADADERIEALSALPEMIRGSSSLEELEQRVIAVLLRGIPRAAAAALVHLPGNATETTRVGVRAVEQRPPLTTTMQPSRRLVFDALYKKRQSVMHLWSGGTDLNPMYTHAAGLDWALCTPVPDPLMPGLALYVTGKMTGFGFLRHPAGEDGKADLLRSDLKFAQTAADIFGALRQVTTLQKREGVLARFFSQPVRQALSDQDLDAVLQPRETTVTVLFCDLRGSCRLHDEGGQNLLSLWQRVTDALGIMSSAIVGEDGVVNDFQGDAVMGFWGWPLPQPDQIERAARAALAIRRRFAEVSHDRAHHLHGFAYGIGLAHGSALAGRLGTSDQFKVDVFGPTVNLAARLESMTKQFGVPILLDEACQAALRQPDHQDWARVRRLAKVQPFGMQRQLMVGELLPPEPDANSPAARQQQTFDQALDLFLKSQWKEAQQVLSALPQDGPCRFLLSCMQGKPAAPKDWNGAVELKTK